jgi:hypothetical protein
MCRRYIKGWLDFGKEALLPRRQKNACRTYCLYAIPGGYGSAFFPSISK